VTASTVGIDPGRRNSARRQASGIEGNPDRVTVSCQRRPDGEDWIGKGRFTFEVDGCPRGTNETGGQAIRPTLLHPVARFATRRRGSVLGTSAVQVRGSAIGFVLVRAVTSVRVGWALFLALGGGSWECPVGSVRTGGGGKLNVGWITLSTVVRRRFGGGFLISRDIGQGSGLPARMIGAWHSAGFYSSPCRGGARCDGSGTVEYSSPNPWTPGGTRWIALAGIRYLLPCLKKNTRSEKKIEEDRQTQSG